MYTFWTRYFAASEMLMSSLADVSNQLIKPLSEQYSSIWLALLTSPSLAWSHCQTNKQERNIKNHPQTSEASHNNTQEWHICRETRKEDYIAKAIVKA